MDSVDPNIFLGRLTLRGSSIRIGDAWFPPRGTEIKDLPIGDVDVYATTTTDRRNHLTFARFWMDFGGTPIGAHDDGFSIDGGIVAIADPKVPTPESCFSRMRKRWSFDRQLAPLTKLGIPSVALQDEQGISWAIAVYVGDGIYPLKISTLHSQVVRIECDLGPRY